MKFSANLSTMFQEYDVLDRFEAARQAGFKGVEIQFPYDFEPGDISKAAADARVDLVLINTPPGDMAAGERGFTSLPGREAEFRADIQRTSDYVAATGVPRVHVMGGCPPADDDPLACREAVETNAAHAAAELQKVGARALLEPLNNQDNPRFFMPTSEQCVDVIQTVGHPNLGLQFDIYHAQVMGTDPAREIARWFDHIGHVQFADAPGRHEPGTGEIDFAAAITALRDLQYQGWVGAEYIPSGRTEESFGWKAEFEKLGGAS